MFWLLRIHQKFLLGLIQHSSQRLDSIKEREGGTEERGEGKGKKEYGESGERKMKREELDREEKEILSVERKGDGESKREEKRKESPWRWAEYKREE